MEPETNSNLGKSQSASWLYILLGISGIGLLYTASQFVGFAKAIGIGLTIYYYYPVLLKSEKIKGIVSILLGLLFILIFSNFDPVLCALFLAETVIPIIVFEIARNSAVLKSFNLYFVAIPFLLLSITLFGSDFLKLANFPEAEKLIEDLTKVYRQMNITENQINQLISGVKTIYNWVKLLLPSIYFISSLFPALIAIFLRQRKEESIAFNSFRLNDMLLIALLGSIIMSIWSPYRIGYNLFIVLAFLWMVQGLAVFSFHIRKRNLSRSLLWVFIAFIIIEPLLAAFVFIVGLFDQFFDFRVEKEKKEQG
ncbi:MAG: DUF2232 domain-containing protein [Candidatus Coatesbacteria bacterium]|nr:DUF2232 domain-containing protein [Candidatus Coatesbacteria bacterium]